MSWPSYRAATAAVYISSQLLQSTFTGRKNPGAQLTENPLSRNYKYMPTVSTVIKSFTPGPCEPYLCQGTDDSNHSQKHLDITEKHNFVTESNVDFCDIGDQHLANLLDGIRPAMIQLYSSFHPSSLDNVSFLGSGFIYDQEGLALTAGHLFEKSSDPPRQLYFFAKLSDGRWFKLSLVGISQDADVAVIRLISRSVKSFPSVKLEKEQRLPQQGQPVIAYGSTQYGDEPVVTFGRVSQPQQSFKELKVGIKSRLIQIALIAVPGFSGSPVFNTKGKVIAMIVKKFENYALALPVSQISPVADSIVQYGSWSMPYFGLVVKAQPNELYDEIMDGVDVNTIRADSDSANISVTSVGTPQSWNCDTVALAHGTCPTIKTTTSARCDTYPILVDGVKPHSPAEKAGIQQNDVITHINKVPLTSYYQLFENTQAMNSHSVSLGIRRESKKFEVIIQPTTHEAVLPI